MKMKVRTSHKFQDHHDHYNQEIADFYANDTVHRHNYSPLSNSTKKSLSKSGEIYCDSEKRMMMMSTKVWNLQALTDALPLSPYSPSRSIGSPSDLARLSAEFYTPTYQDVQKSSTVFSTTNQQRPRSKCLSVSTLYESATGIEFGVQNQNCSGNGCSPGVRSGQQNDKNSSPRSLSNSAATYEYESSVILDGSDHDVLCLLPPVPEEMALWKGMNATALSANCQGFAGATPVTIEEDYRMSHRPKPYSEFLDEVQSHKKRAELDTARKEKYTHLLNKLRAKEAAIDAWESAQQSKIENGLDILERKLEKKRAQAVKRTHTKLIDTKQEAEKRKAIARRSILKEMSKLPEQRKSKRTPVSKISFLWKRSQQPM